MLPSAYLSFPCVSPPFFYQNIFISTFPYLQCPALIYFAFKEDCFALIFVCHNVASNWSLCSSEEFCIPWSLFATGLPLIDPTFTQAFPTYVTLCLTFAPFSIYFLNNAFSSLFPSLFTYYISRLGRNSSLWTMFSPVFLHYAVYIITVILLVWTCWPYSVSPGCLCLVGRC